MMVVWIQAGSTTDVQFNTVQSCLLSLSTRRVVYFLSCVEATAPVGCKAVNTRTRLKPCPRGLMLYRQNTAHMVYINSREVT